MASVYLDIKQKVHGSGIANCSNYPKITAKFRITFSRNPGSDLVTWSTSGMGNWGHNTSGTYGYKFHAYIKVSSGSSSSDYKSIISKENTTDDNWWNHTTTYNPSGSLRSTAKTATVKIYVKNKHTCMHSEKYCFNGSGTYYTVATYTVTLPPYGVTITYNGNGADSSTLPDPNPQIITTLPGTLSDRVPQYPLIANYYYGDTPDPVDILPLDASGQPTGSRTFLGWLGSDGNTYSPGDTYSANTNCTMTAQWDNVIFSPRPQNDKYVTITYHCNGGYINGESDPVVPIYFNKYGYGTDPLTSTVDYVPGESYTIGPAIATLNLYPRFASSSTITELATPIRKGYAFNGWYYDNGTWQQPATTPLTISENIELYAKWTPVPVHKFDNNEWKDSSQYVWRFNGTAWEKVAHIYSYNGDNWIDISEN